MGREAGYPIAVTIRGSSAKRLSVAGRTDAMKIRRWYGIGSKASGRRSHRGAELDAANEAECVAKSEGYRLASVARRVTGVVVSLVPSPSTDGTI
jgi:hypothetical protein